MRAEMQPGSESECRIDFTCDHLKANRNALFVSLYLQPEVLNRVKVVRKQSLSSTVLITVWRLAESCDCPVMSQIRSYPEHVTFIFRHNQKLE